VDEVGRGPLAGPVVAAAVILPPPGDPSFDLIHRDDFTALVIDSKQLAAPARRRAAQLILKAAVATSVAAVSSRVIDRIGIGKAVLKAMEHAVRRLPVPPDFALIDGNRLPVLSCPARTLIGGDAASHSIAAASILAKVTRDRLMERLGRFYPDYTFEQHKGYGTAEHRRAIERHGPTPHHRLSFAPLAHSMPKNLRASGDEAEEAAANHLLAQGYSVLTRNYRTRRGEIDIVAREGATLIFVEVKRGSPGSPIPPLLRVTLRKQARIIRAATDYLTQTEASFEFVRFDAMGLTPVRGGKWQVEHLRGAFTADGWEEGLFG